MSWELLFFYLLYKDNSQCVSEGAYFVILEWMQEPVRITVKQATPQRMIRWVGRTCLSTLRVQRPPLIWGLWNLEMTGRRILEEEAFSHKDYPRSGDFKKRMRTLQSQRDYNDREEGGLVPLSERTVSDYRRLLLIGHNSLRQKHHKHPLMASNVVLRPVSCSLFCISLHLCFSAWPETACLQ